MPDDQAKEKSQLLAKFGAEVVLVKPASIVNAKHYVNEAKRLAHSIKGEETQSCLHVHVAVLKTSFCLYV